MSDTPYSPVKPPKTITQIKDYDYLDFTSSFTIILLIFVIVAFGLVLEIGIQPSVIIKAVLVVFLAGWSYTWYKLLSSPEKTEKTLLTLRFRYKDTRGRHIINKFDSYDKTLLSIVPIVGIHNDGIIEFKGKKWGIVMELHPKRISDEEREAHEKRMEKVVNGIPANTHFKTIACSRLEPRKPIMQYILEITSQSSGKKATDQHLAGLYNKVASDGTPVISWKYYAFQSLGEQKTYESAKIQYGAVIPGLLKNMKMAQLQPVIIEDPMEVAMAYRTMLTEMII
jgi:hypothetical protein